MDARTQNSAISIPSDIPFHLPPDDRTIVHVLNLPLCPSVNRIWRANKTGKNRVSRSPEYKAWLRDAGYALMEQGALRGRRMIAGKFTAIIEIRRDWTALEPNKFDLDNRIKGIFDFCQQYQFIKNDRELEEYTVRWSSNNAPMGCRVTLRSLPR